SPPQVHAQVVDAPIADAPSVGGYASENNSDQYRIWGNAEYLMWWLKSAPTPRPFLLNATAVTAGGVVLPGAPVTTLLGGGSIDTNERNGGKFTLGAWLDCDHTIGVEGSFFFIGQKNTTRTAGIAGTALNSPFLLIPLISPGVVAPAGLFLAENTLVGSGAVNTLTVRNDLFGFEGNGFLNLARNSDYQLDLISGFRYLQFEESLGFRAAFNSPGLFAFPPTTPALAIAPAGTNVGLGVGYSDQNRFYGGNLGARGEVKFGNFFVNGTGKVALGVMEENLSRVAGLTGVAVPAGLGITPAVVQHFNDVNRFAVVPEANLNVGYQIADIARAYVGYDFLYASDVVRPGEQINPAGFIFNPVMKHSDFWAQGINFGLELRY
ncbi:MAG: BBP7 family outer membrane beta-barrel protein, partial [Planctomycetes bacterium]|nr:BBP7 family outer membrane beta-barrel protein [Planctomycetota bacterium]